MLELLDVFCRFGQNGAFVEFAGGPAATRIEKSLILRHGGGGTTEGGDCVSEIEDFVVKFETVALFDHVVGGLCGFGKRIG